MVQRTHESEDEEPSSTEAIERQVQQYCNKITDLIDVLEMRSIASGNDANVNRAKIDIKSLLRKINIDTTNDERRNRLF